MISVVTITYNNFNDLVATIKSLPSNGIQSVVINGGRDSQTKLFLEKYSGVAISESDRGISDAFNKGITNSTGDAIVFLNSGDILADTLYYKDATDILSHEDDIDFIYADIVFKDSLAGHIILKSNGKLPNMPFLHPTLIVRRRVFDKIGKFNLKYKSAMDLDFVYRMLNAKFKGKYIPRIVVEMDGEGISSQKHWINYKEKFSIVCDNRDFDLLTWIVLIKLFLVLVVKTVLSAVGQVGLLKAYKRLKYQRARIEK